MRWEDERYVRVYTRDTLNWRLLGFNGRAILMLLLRQVDRAGVLEIGEVAPAEALALMLDAPLDVAEAGWRSLLATKSAVLDGTRIVIPNFLEAQEARSSDAERQRKSRDLARVTKRDVQSHTVTETPVSVTICHTPSQPVTPSLAVPSLAVPSSKKEQQIPPPPKAAAPVTAPAWSGYSTAYSARYKAQPVRNATVNGQLSQLVKRLGAEEAPDVAAWYVGHNGARYVAAGHSVGLLLADAEKLRTEWATGRQITTSQARQVDKTQGNLNNWASLLRPVVGS